MRTVFFFCCLLGLGSSHAVQAQSSSRDPEEISTGQLLVQRLGADNPAASTNDFTSVSNQATLQQRGNQNQGRIDQHMIGVGQGNVAGITQSGTGNVAAILQNGAGSRTSIMQVGANNVAASQINGFNTESEITQKGSSNYVDQRLNVDDRRYTVEQMGNNNNLVQRESGSTAPGYDVSMKGNGIRIVIEQGRVSTLP